MGETIGCLGPVVFGIIFLSAFSAGVESGWIFVICCIGIVGSIFLGNYIVDKERQQDKSELRKWINKKVQELVDFTISQEFVSPDMQSYIAIDESNNKVCIIENQYDNNKPLSSTFSKYDYKTYVLSFEDILKTEILEDGATVTETSRGSQIGGALLGGVLAGGVGSVIGGLSGSSSSEEEVKTLQLQIIVNDTKKSFHRISFMSNETSIPKDNKLYKNANKNITHWHNLLSYLIKLADSEIDENVSEGQSSNSNADEIRKLIDLLNDGFLTEEEFNAEKEKILNR